MSNSLEALLALDARIKARRQQELEEAFQNPQKLDDLILRDAARLTAGLGYCAPLVNLDEWTREKMHNDASFNAQTHAIANQIREYVQAARERAVLHGSDPYENHIYCSVCRECMTCSLRPCRDGGEHKQ